MTRETGPISDTGGNRAEIAHTCTKLTTCRIAADGRALRLHFLDGDGRPAFLELPHEHAQSLVMTLPHLLTAALQTRTGDANARFVFPLDHWALELTDVRNCVLLTLRTTDGFAASFSVAADTCQQIGTEMHSAADVAAEASPGTAPRH
jgi:hypothetical protein